LPSSVSVVVLHFVMFPHNNHHHVKSVLDSTREITINKLDQYSLK